MSIQWLRSSTLALAILGLACGGPFGLMPGGELSGEVQPPPSDWSFAGDSGTAQLETDPGQPYSVNLAYTILDGIVYLNAGDTETQWVKNMDADPAVRLRVEGKVFELQAERVTDGAEIKRFASAWTDQSMFRRDPAGLEQVWIYRLRAR